MVKQLELPSYKEQAPEVKARFERIKQRAVELVGHVGRRRRVAGRHRHHRVRRIAYVERPADCGRAAGLADAASPRGKQAGRWKVGQTGADEGVGDAHERLEGHEERIHRVADLGEDVRGHVDDVALRQHDVRGEIAVADLVQVHDVDDRLAGAAADHADPAGAGEDRLASDEAEWITGQTLAVNGGSFAF